MESPEAKRRHERFSVSLSATVTRTVTPMDASAKMTFPARLVDVSQSGAKLELKEMVAPREQVRVKVAPEAAGFGLDVSGVIRWSKKVTGGYEAGVEFATVRKFQLKGASKQAPQPKP